MSHHQAPASLSPIESPRLALWLLFGINLVNFFDRQILASVIEPLRQEWHLGDTLLGWLVTAFTLLYAGAGLPLGRLADTHRRNRLLAAGLILWSGLTILSGFCRNYWQLFAARLGVGVGEAVCAPAGSSLIGDLFRPQERARAMSVFMLGLPLGVALSYLLGGTIAHHYGWRAVFYFAGIPGFLLAGAAVFLREPARGRSEVLDFGSARRPGSPVRIILSIATMRWIILSGLLHNFIMYAFTFFFPSLLVRYYGTTVQTAGWISALVIGTVGALGMMAGGWIGDRASIKCENGRMMISGAAILAAAPLGLVALLLPADRLLLFVILQGAATLLMYTYYPMVYATIHDVVEPALRGRAMAIYFFAMYVLGASLGPVATGWLSDYFAVRSAISSGFGGPGPIPEQFRARGLHRAMLAIPALSLFLAAVLFAVAAVVRKDILRLRSWIHSKSGT